MKSFAFATALLFAACASGPTTRPPRTTMGTPDPAAADAPPPDGVTCTEEVPTGSLLGQKICRSESEKAMDRRAAEELYLNPVARSPSRP